MVPGPLNRGPDLASQKPRLITLSVFSGRRRGSGSAKARVLDGCHTLAAKEALESLSAAVCITQMAALRFLSVLCSKDTKQGFCDQAFLSPVALVYHTEKGVMSKSLSLFQVVL